MTGLLLALNGHPSRLLQVNVRRRHTVEGVLDKKGLVADGRISEVDGKCRSV